VVGRQSRPVEQRPTVRTNHESAAVLDVQGVRSLVIEDLADEWQLVI